MMPAESKLAGSQKWGPPVHTCYWCGSTPVRLEMTLAAGRKLFAFMCPNGDCRKGRKTPKSGAWKPSRQEAADYWNNENEN